jgi:hypothetical protein
MTSRVVAAAFDGDFEIVLSRRADRCNNVGYCCAPNNDAWVSIKATIPNLA